MTATWCQSFKGGKTHLFRYQRKNIVYFVCGIEVPAYELWLPLASGYCCEYCSICKRVETMQELAE